MKNFKLKFSGVFLIFLISLFLVIPNVKADNYFDEYQTGVHWLYQSTVNYTGITSGGVSNEYWQQIAPWQICENENQDGNCEINSINFYPKITYTGTTTSDFDLYESSTIPTSRNTLGTLIETFNIEIPGTSSGYSSGDLFNAYQTFDSIILDKDKYYTLHLKTSSYYGFSLPYYTNNVRTDLFTKYYNISDSYPAWRNTSDPMYDFQIWFGLTGDATGYTFQDWEEIKAYTGLDQISILDITPKENNCIATSSASEPCQYAVNYSTYISGSDVTLELFERYITGQTYSDISESIASTTLYTGFNITTIQVPYEISLEDKTIDYTGCLAFGGEISEICIDDISVKWLGQEYEEWVDYNYGYLFEEERNPCEEVATSSGSFADDFRYGFECGIREVIDWFFYPSVESINKLKIASDDIKEEFPINIISGINEIFSSEYATTTALLLPALDQNGEVMSYIVDEEKIRASDNFWVVEEVKTIFSVVVYFLFGLYIILRIVSMVRKNENE